MVPKLAFIAFKLNTSARPAYNLVAVALVSVALVTVALNVPRLNVCKSNILPKVANRLSVIVVEA